MERKELEQLVSLCSAGSWEEVLATTRSLAIDDFKDDEAAQVLFFEGLALLHLDKPEQAQQAVVMGLGYGATRPELLDLAARVSSALGRMSEAALYHERAMAHATEQVKPVLMLNYAATLTSEESFAEALRLVETAELAGQKCHESDVLAARCYAGLGRMEEAMERYSAIVLERPGDVASRLGLANSAACLGRPEVAEPIYQSLLGNGFDGEVLYDWAVSRLTEGDAAGAISLLRRIGQDDRVRSAAMGVHGKALIAMGAEDAGLQLIQKAIGRLTAERGSSVLYDDFCASEAEALGEDGDFARRRLLARIARNSANLPRCFSVLALMNEPLAGSPALFEVEFTSKAGAGLRRLTVAASSSDDALSLAREIHLPDDLANMLASVRPGGRLPPRMKSLPPVRGVLERHLEGRPGLLGDRADGNAAE